MTIEISSIHKTSSRLGVGDKVRLVDLESVDPEMFGYKDYDEFFDEVARYEGKVGTVVGIEVNYPEEPQPAYVDVETEDGWLFTAISTLHLRRIISV